MTASDIEAGCYPFCASPADEFVLGDLTQQSFAASVIDQPFEEVYQFAADMGGAGYLFTGENDAQITRNSALMNLHVADFCHKVGVRTVFAASSACVYAEEDQMDPNNPNCRESSVYPANPDSEYGWEKIFCERLFLSYNRQHGMNCKIGRFHNIFGPEGTWDGGREKVPAAMCRKVAEAPENGSVEVWGDGLQTRSFLYVDEAIEGTRRLMQSDFCGPVNIGSEEMISINDLARLVMEIAGKQVDIRNVPGPEGVRGRRSDNDLIEQELGWAPSLPLRSGLEKTYAWISGQVANRENRPETRAEGL